MRRLSRGDLFQLEQIPMVLSVFVDAVKMRFVPGRHAPDRRVIQTMAIDPRKVAI